jgi:hypothetical protein
MREIRPSGSEGGVRFKPSSLPLSLHLTAARAFRSAPWESLDVLFALHLRSRRR